MAFGLGGLRIIESPHLTEMIEDWSDVRSPGRAARRRRYGHRQRIRYVEVPKRVVLQLGNALVMHPDLARQVRDLVPERPPSPGLGFRY